MSIFPMGKSYIREMDYLDLGNYICDENRENIKKIPINNYNEWAERKFNKYIMICGGTGITPIYFVRLKP